MTTDLAATIDAAWEARDTIGFATGGPVRDAVETSLDALDAGRLRVAERGADGFWAVHQWLKKAVLLSFRLNDNAIIDGPAAGAPGFAARCPARSSGAGRSSARARC